MTDSENVLGTELTACSLSPLTGFRRDGVCRAEKDDIGVHGVCSEMTESFLAFTRNRGNDLSTPNPAFGFPGLKPGDRWCLCASRWKEACDRSVAPPVVLSSTSRSALKYVDLETLKRHAVDTVD